MSDVKSGDQDKYAPGNTGSDGSYIVGKGKPPESGKFRKGDGRRRGRRRPKVPKSLGADFLEEIRSLVTVTVNGKQHRVTKQRAILMRLIDNAAKGHAGAIKSVLSQIRQYTDDKVFTEEELDKLTLDELTILEFFAAKLSGEVPTADTRKDIDELLERIGLDTIGWEAKPDS